MKRKIQRSLRMIMAFILVFGMVFETPAFSLKARADGVAAPSFTPGGGTYNTTQSVTVTITCATEGAKIYYTTDGTNPVDSVNDLVGGSIEYTGPIEVAAGTSMTIKAVAKKDTSTSSVRMASYEINTALSPVETPNITPAEGTYVGPLEVEISCAAEGAKIYYTTDGTEPSATCGSVYQNPFQITKTCTVKACAVKEGMADARAEKSYTITGSGFAQVAELQFTPDSGTFAEAQSVTISCATEGATIYYTTDRSRPTKYSAVYSEPIVVSETTYISAVAMKDGMLHSHVVGGNFKITKVATPTFSPAAGTYTGTQNVEISCATTGAQIYYTTDGSDPSTGSTLYNGAITVEESKTIKAIAVKDGLDNSEIAEAAYTISGVTILNDGYPYGKNMSTGQITLVVEAESTETLTYQWEIADTKDGTFASISGATGSEYTFAPEHGKWYRCMVSGVASYAVQAVKPQTDSLVRTWTNHYNGGEQWYLSNGPVAYTVVNEKTDDDTVQGFDVVGEYEKDDTTYMLCTSFSGLWDVYKGDGTADSTDTFATLPKMMFSFSDQGVMITASGFTENGAPGNFCFDCDTQLGNGETSGGYSDKGALIASLNKDRTLKQIAMVGAASKADAKEEDPAFVIAPAGNPMFWIGEFNSRVTFSYNTSGDENKKSSVTGSEEKVVTSVEGTDSGMTMSWKNVTEVSFGFAVGSVADIGAISENIDIDYAEEKITHLDPNTEYVITVLDKTTGQHLNPQETYTIKALPHEAGQPGNGYILLEGKDIANNSYDLLGKMISITKAGSTDEPGELEIGARPDPTKIETNDPGANTAGKPIDIKLSDAEITATTISIIIDPKDDNAEAKKKQEYKLVNKDEREVDYASSPEKEENGWTMPEKNGRIVFSGLTPNTEYKILTRIPYSDNAPASAAKEAAVKTACNITVHVPSGSATVFTPDGTAKEAPAVTVEGGISPVVSYSTSLSEPYSETLPSYPAGGQYTVYYRITQTGSETIYGTYTVTINPTITFEANGGTFTLDGANKLSDTSAWVGYGEKPENISVTASMDGKTLAGWYTDKSFKNLYWSTNDLSKAPKVFADMTLYARWVDSSSTITIPAESLPADTRIKIRLEKGGVPIPSDLWSTLGTNGFKIGTVPDEEYDLVIMKPSTVGGKFVTITASVRVVSGEIVFPDGKPAFPTEEISSVVDVEPGSPAVVVRGLDQEARATKNGNLIHWQWDGGETNRRAVLELKFGPGEDMTDLTEDEANNKLKSTNEKNIHKAEKAISQQGGSDAEYEFYDITVTRTDYWSETDRPEENTIEELQAPVEIAIPYTVPEGKILRVFRYHGGSVEEFTKLNSRPLTCEKYQDATYYMENGIVYIYTRFFSIYALETEHIHSFSYSANGAIITATCTANCTLSKPATLTIVKPTLTTYGQTGEGISEQATIIDQENLRGSASILYYAEDEDGKKTGSALGSAPVNAGKYRAEITVGTGNNTATAYVSYTIAKANISPTLSIKGWKEKENPENPSVTGNTDNGTITYTYKLKDDDESAYVATVPITAGKYTVKAEIAPTKNYNGAILTADFVIEKNETIIEPEPQSRPEPQPVIITPVNTEPVLPYTTTDTVNNKDGSVTTTTTTYNEDKSITVKTVKEDGYGKKITKITLTDQDGKELISASETKNAKSGKEVLVTKITNEDMSSSYVKMTTTSDGRVVRNSIETNSEGVSDITIGTYTDGTYTGASASTGFIGKFNTSGSKVDAKTIKSVEKLVADSFRLTDNALSDNAVVVTEMKYKVTSDGKAKLTRCRTTTSEITVPSKVTINGKSYRVYTVAKKAFKGCSTLNKVTLGKTVTTIGTKAFAGLENLKEIVFNSKDKNGIKIGKNAFTGIAENAQFFMKAVKDARTKTAKRIQKSGYGNAVSVLKKKNHLS